MPENLATCGISPPVGSRHGCPSTHSGGKSDNHCLSATIPLNSEGSRSRSAQESTETSYESDMLSESSDPEEVEPLTLNAATFLVLSSISQRLLSGFRAHLRSHASSRTCATYPQVKHITTAEPTKAGRKRPYEQGQDEGSDHGGMPPPPPSKKIKQSKDNAPQRQLACPYWKLDPDKHRGCFPKKLVRIRDVKQHLSRKHTPEFYCECCFKIFKDEDSHQAHVTHASGDVCIRDPSASLDGISHQRHRQLSKKSNPKLSEEQQWFVIWDVLFPGAQRPRSAYLDHALSEQICQFQEYCHKHGPAMLDGVLEPEVPDTEMRANLLRIIEAGMNSLFDDWYARRSRGWGPSNGSSITLQENSQIGGLQLPTPHSSLDSDILAVDEAHLSDNPTPGWFQHASMNAVSSQALQILPQVPPMERWDDANNFQLGEPAMTNNPHDLGSAGWLNFPDQSSNDLFDFSFDYDFSTAGDDQPRTGDMSDHNGTGQDT
ncbi:hypothetical protein ACJZ2D_013848 [Fusarium nematophilum]